MVTVNGVELYVETTGDGPTVVALHGFPHTGRIWDDVVAGLAADRRVVVPDLRGFGASTLTADGMDAATLSRDVEELIESVAAAPVTLVAIDAAVPPAFLLGLRRPDLLARLVLAESTLGPAEGFAPPWWFGFHAVPGLAERVLRGHEAEYVGWFYDQGTRDRGVRPELRATLGEAFARPGALAAALGVYRALPRSARQVADAVASGTRLRVPTTAIGAAPVGRTLEHQLRPVTDELRGHLVPECGHIIPVDRPEAFGVRLRGL